MTLSAVFWFLICAALGCERPPVKISDGTTTSDQSEPASIQELPNIVEFLPVGETDAMLLELQPPENVIEIGRKMTQAIAGQPAWIESYTKLHSNLRPGESLPYHENLGVTEQEYDLLCDTLEKTPLTPSVPCTLKIRDEGNGRFNISVVGDSEELTAMSGLVIDTNEMSVTFAGITATSWTKSESPANAPFRVDGIRWKTELETPNADNIETLFVRVGSNLKNGNGILMFRVLHVLDGEMLSQGEINLEWQR